jgi:hypothetical protein
MSGSKGMGCRERDGPRIFHNFAATETALLKQSHYFEFLQIDLLRTWKYSITLQRANI